MTGIQALQRAYPAQPMKLGRVERIEFEYIRRGVVALIANWHISWQQVLMRMPTLVTTVLRLTRI
ncbi:hypothetical protein [Scytonema sp. PCC 10023]|uniref:hypothetical protein n=1 Tax=Scytonema sp. PCC 10023 TaxID=1680591 RepID=UPI0039C6066A